MGGDGAEVEEGMLRSRRGLLGSIVMEMVDAVSIIISGHSGGVL